MGIKEHSDATSCLSSLRFPSPQRGRGVRGEGESTLLIDPRKTQTLSQRRLPRADRLPWIPPHPQPLSHIGARGAEVSYLSQQTGTHYSPSLSGRTSPVGGTRGFTLIELMMVLTVISILVSIAIPIANSAIIRSKEAVLRSNLYTLRTLIDQYTADKLKAPQSLDDIVAAGYLRSLPKDPITNRNDTWQIVMEDASLFPEQTETGIFDVHSGSTATSSEGTPYSEW
jgi:general secretion pathway protein G